MLRYAPFVEKHCWKNRTIVSRDIEPILRDIGELVGLDMTIHRYSSGMDIGTWIVPDRWDVREAWLKGPDGTMVASYDEHPLFLAPYSMPFSGTVDLAELKQHVRCHPTRRDAFYYEHRLAYDYGRRLKEWLVTLPASRLEALPEGEYTVHLDLDVAPGEMLVGEIVLPGRERDSVALLTDYCHPGQANDSLSGILAMIDVMKALAARPDRRFTYRFLVFPETIGSSVLLESRPEYIEDTRLAIFSEFVGWGSNWKILADTQPDTLSCRLAQEAGRRFTGLKPDHREAGYCNDEIVFDFVGVPSLSVQMSECAEYHSSDDHPRLLDQANIDRAASIILYLCDIMEADERFTLTHRVPIYMSRYQLYADYVHQTEQFNWNRAIIRGLRDGRSLLEIAAGHGMDFDYVKAYVDRMRSLELARPAAGTR